MDAKKILAGMTAEEQTEWLKAHMPEWEQFVEGIRLSREQLAEHRAAGKPGYPPGWITVEEFRRLRALSTPSD
jgi:hypothetical protein